MTDFSGTSILTQSSQTGKNLKIGDFSVIKEDVKIGDNCIIGNNVVIYAGVNIGDNVRIDDSTVIGKLPMRSKWSVMKNKVDIPETVIGNNIMIGSQVAIYAGSRIGNGVLIADSASVRENVSIGDNTIVGRLVTIEQDSSVGKRCKLETGCYITAFSCIEDFCFIAPMVTTTNDNYLGRTEERLKHFRGVTIRRGGRIGANATILPGIEIGADAVIAAGSVVTRDVPPEQTVIGVPAKFFRSVPDKQLLKNQKWEL